MARAKFLHGKDRALKQKMKSYVKITEAYFRTVGW